MIFFSLIQSIGLFFRLLFFLFFMNGMSTVNAVSVGTTKIEFKALGLEKTVIAELFYPSAVQDKGGEIDFGLFRRRSYTENADLLDKKRAYPLVVFSHGNKGDRFHHCWLAEALVDAGYIVAMIEHAGDWDAEYLYTNLWQRPLEVSALLDYVLNPKNKWSYVIDSERIAVGGFSLGGLTVLWLSGMQADTNLFKKKVLDQYFKVPIQDKKNIQWQKLGESYFDSRIKAVFAIAPNGGQGFLPSGIQKATLPILLITGTDDTVLYPDLHIYHYHKHLPNAQLYTLAGGEHFDFVGKSSALGKKEVPFLFANNPLIDRDVVHKKTASNIISFLSKYLLSDTMMVKN